MGDNKPTLHHLNNSQSQRILWLLEELNIDYNLILHTRNPLTHPSAPLRAPPALTSTGPYGKSPLLITGRADGSRYLPESAAIATYLIRTFDTTDAFGLRSGDWIRDEVLTSLNTTVLLRACSFMMYLDWGIIQPTATAVGKRVDGRELRAALGDLERELKEGPEKGEAFFMGEKPGRADILMEFPLTMVKQSRWVDLKTEFPALDAWLERVYARDAWKRALEKGNGYDFRRFPRVRSRGKEKEKL